MSLYRKYRPQTFADVVGQDHIVTTLENAVTQGKLAHAYLFAGSRGTGKTSVARILAKHILTTGLEDETLRRQVETAVVDGTIVDLIEIDGASNRRIEDSRDLVEKIQFSPVVTKAKVYIIDEVHMLTKEAFNALLKTLEEPPAYAFFILATTELHKIPATIQSRCQRFSFHQIREEDIVRRLQFIADQERITVDRAALRAISRHAQGGMRDAISLLDQLRSLEKIALLDVQQRIGESGQEHVEGLLDAINSGDRQTILRIVQLIEEAGTPLDTFVRQLLTEVRTRLHASIDAGESTAAYEHLLASLLNALRDIRIAPVPGLVFEAALLTLTAAPATKQEVKAAKRKEEVKEKEIVTETVEKTKEKAISEAIVEAPPLTKESVSAFWPKLQNLAEPPALRMSLKNGRIRSVDEKNITLSFASKFHRDRVAQKEGIHTLEQLLIEYFKRPVRLECVVDEEQGITPLTDEHLVDLAQAVGEIF